MLPGDEYRMILIFCDCILHTVKAVIGRYINDRFSKIHRPIHQRVAWVCRGIAEREAAWKTIQVQVASIYI